jgi:hypothetical protein
MTPEKAHTFMPFTYLCHNLRYLYNNNNNNQAFYSQASWGRLEMKSHETKKRYKTRAKKGKTKGDKKPNKKRRKENKTLSQKVKKGQGKKT